MRTRSPRHVTPAMVAASALAAGLLISAAGSGGAADATHRSTSRPTSHTAAGGALASEPGTPRTVSSGWSSPGA
ncbi:hypothetical protein [Streptomyces halobius]|uniref:Uncharacterized protein n=1 Tax=Streptomyces halobius TaxID=2879846 RepID=A0ABY4M149_9ACTN|nr:hypothetical protein [Streptomyces halobius]UQA91494.1 hypothetical protein K9S39_06080 [Streptomyces halobius]